MDDKDLVQKIARKLLERLGYDVELANDGKEAIEKFKCAIEMGKPFNAALLDLTVPGGMGGVETIGKLFEIDPNVKGIASSGYSNDPVMASFRDYGFKGIITKPYRIEDLAEILREVIGE
jgi:CheY-like chemotaxis protein